MGRFSPAQNISAPPLALSSGPAPQTHAARSPAPFLSMGVAVPSDNALGKAAVILGFYVFLFAAPVAEIISIFLHVNSHIVLFWGLVVLPVFLLTGRTGRFFSVPIAKPWMALLLLFFIAAGTGMYRSFSLKVILGYAALVHILPLLFCAIAVTTRQVRHLMYWASAGFLLVLVVCWRTGKYSADYRFYVPDVEALGNPNDLAFGLLFASTFFLLLAVNRSFLSRTIWLVAFPIAVAYAMKTGSRANLLTLLFMAIVVLFLVPLWTKLVFLAVTFLMAGFLSLTVPSTTWQRLTLFSVNPQVGTAPNEMLESAAESQIARLDLQKRAIQIIVRHPLLGVGPFLFADAVDNMVRSTEGHKSGWQSPHNVYLQIAAENGIPALLLFVASIVYCIRLNYQSYKLQKGIKERRMERLQSLCLLLATCDYAFGILFCSVGYYSYLGLLVAFTAANFLAVQNEMRRKTPSLAAPPGDPLFG